MAFISDQYIAASLNKLSGFFKMSQVLAGATLVTIANGAPDIITSVSASFAKNNDGPIISLASLYGANVFCMTITFAVVIFVSKKSHIECVLRQNLLNLSFFFLTTLSIIIFGAFEVSTLLVGLTLLGIYMTYIIIVVFEDIREQKKLKEDSKLDLHCDEVLNTDSEPRFDDGTQENALKSNLIDTDSYVDISSEPKVKESKLDCSNNLMAETKDNLELKKKNAHSFVHNQGINEDEELRNSLKLSNKKRSTVKVSAKKIIRRVNIQWKEAGVLGKIIYIIEYPLNNIVAMTVPPVEKPLIHQKLICLYSFTTVWAFLL